ncbi:AraC family transcriptional regulator [Virgibacillus sp. LDC1]|jgi:AraC family transcriptional regulator, arabinose operon regulatory protein|uniref:AraC family transcriptional regulator n=1 Tax=Paenibacillus TaxID=44249 RepID=UPI000C270D4C|nr:MULTISPECIES: AraC family transcriptional regulator [Paenibacillus]MCV4230043.1 AraC family transcriptional regulator [Virgibacillus sp. LDC1]MBU5345337.1 AraC family transcriptional regulator [Paenibacillus lautus]MBX4149704.1 AraC family transcriptional regulator [Paenibacillus lautus]MEC0205268.1 AraC family transcriptional regulator [Paenibacillus lautus]MEC0255133.1 AraC family transcriptional regulator [Paenibacillus lautus]
MDSNLSNQVVAADFSFHRKPFKMSLADGFDTYLMRWQTDGKCRAKIDDELSLVEAGDLLIFTPGQPYELRIDDEYNALGELTIESGDYHIFFKGPWADAWWNSKKRPTKIRVPLEERYLSLFRQILLEQRRVSDPYPEISDYTVRILCLEVDRLLSEQPSTTPKTYLAYRMKNYIEENASSMFKLEDVAAHVGISVSRAVHLFKEAFGTTIMQYTMDVRLSMAKERIVFSPLSLEDVAETSGFANYTYFHRVFRSRFGVSPKQFRMASRTSN